MQSWCIDSTYVSEVHAVFTALFANVPVVVSAEARVATARINGRTGFKKCILRDFIYGLT